MFKRIMKIKLESMGNEGCHIEGKVDKMGYCGREPKQEDGVA
jgi:hypothetical protein